MGYLPHLPLYLTKIITFDSRGVSGHPNHVAIAQACVSLPIDVYTLSSVPLWRKYLSVFDALYYFFHPPPSANYIFYVATPKETLTIRSAMVNAHKSQMVWYRWGYILLSRYMMINDLILLPPDRFAQQ